MTHRTYHKCATCAIDIGQSWECYRCGGTAVMAFEREPQRRAGLVVLALLYALFAFLVGALVGWCGLL